MPRTALTPNVRFNCPICGSRISLGVVDSHLSKKHPDITEHNFLSAVQAGLKAGAIPHELTGVIRSPKSATDVLCRERITNKIGILSVTNAGSPGLKKRRT